MRSSLSTGESLERTISAGDLFDGLVTSASITHLESAPNDRARGHVAYSVSKAAIDLDPRTLCLELGL